MIPVQILRELEENIPTGTPLVSAIEKFIDFFSATHVDGCPKDSDGDMLLFQWGGPYSWDNYFSINLTRQFSFADDSGEYDGMQQLQMNCRYQVGEISVEEGNEWLDGGDIEAFLQSVLDAPCVRAARDMPMQSLEFSLGDV